MDQIKAIEVFIAVANRQSFSAAARYLNVSNASVTRHINDLERFLGVTLLTRTTRALSLTDVGNIYLREVEDILPQLYAANDIARGEKLKPQGVLKITAPILFGQMYVTPVIRKYLDLYPDVSVEATFLDRKVAMIEEGFDVAIRIGHLADSNMRAVKLCDVQWTVCASPQYWQKNGYPIRPDELSKHQIIGYINESDNLEWHFTKNKTVYLQSRLRLSSVTACIESAKQNWGIARALSYQVAPMLKEGSLERVLQTFEKPPIPVTLLHNDHSMSSAKISAFKSLMLEGTKEV